VGTDQPAPAPQQVNEIGGQAANGNAQQSADGKGSGSGQELATDQMISSSKHKKKKGLSKIVPH
jgi:hypothetical protein